MKTLLLSALLAAALPLSAQQYVTVGDPGNANDTTGYGAVAGSFGIGTYEVTNQQYVAFLNAKAASDPNGLYNASMNTNANGGIIQLGSSGAFTYSAKVGYESKPVVLVSFLDAMRYANWLHNGQGSGDTETGAYTLSLGGLAPRNGGAQFWIPSENEWYKAAYYQPAGSGGDVDSYWLYATGTNTLPNSRNGSASDANSANFYFDDGIANGFNGGYAVTNSTSLVSSQNYLTDVGAFTLADSYYGTSDQGGNVYEWNDTIIGGGRGVRGGSWGDNAAGLTVRTSDGASDESIGRGFRVAAIPEPGVGASLLVVLGALAGRRRGR